MSSHRSTRDSRRGWASRRRGGAAGFVLVDVLFAIGVIVVAGVWILAAYGSALATTEVAQQTSVALDDLKDMMEKIKSTAFSQLTANFPNGAVNGIVAPAGDKYGAVVGGYGLTNERITVTHQPGTAADPRELVVTVTWTNRGRTHQRSVTTIRSSKAS